MHSLSLVSSLQVTPFTLHGFIPLKLNYLRDYQQVNVIRIHSQKLSEVSR